MIRRPDKGSTMFATLRRSGLLKKAILIIAFVLVVIAFQSMHGTLAFESHGETTWFHRQPRTQNHGTGTGTGTPAVGAHRFVAKAEKGERQQISPASPLAMHFDKDTAEPWMTIPPIQYSTDNGVAKLPSIQQETPFSETKFTYEPFLLPMPRTLSEEDYRWVKRDRGLFKELWQRTKALCDTDSAFGFLSDLSREQRSRAVALCKSRQSKDDMIRYEKDLSEASVTVVRQRGLRSEMKCGPLKDVVNLETPLNEVKYGKLFIAWAPESWSFQHFIDGALPALLQMIPTLDADPDIKILVHEIGTEPTSPSRIVEAMGIPPDRIVVKKREYWTEFTSAYMYMSCLTLPWHPSLYSIYQDRLHLTARTERPTSTFKVVYFSRSAGDHLRNPVRRVLNEKLVISALRTYAFQRYGEAVQIDVFNEVMDRQRRANVSHLVEYFDDAHLLVGPHGGALYNMIFCRPFSTYIAEILPTTMPRRIVPEPYIFWQVASALRQPYYRIQAKVSQSDLLVDSSAMIRLLDEVIARSGWLDADISE